MKPLDFVKAKNIPNLIGIITETKNNQTHSVSWIGGSLNGLRTAWWKEEELDLIDNLPNLLCREMAHPFGNNKNSADFYYKTT